MSHAVVYDEGGPRGVWLPDPSALPWPAPSAFTPDPVFAEACAGAEGPQAALGHFTPFPNPEAALAGIAKVWTRCLDSAPVSHEGIEISADGRWRLVDLEAGELVARSGFGQEGFVKLTDTSIMNGAGFMQLELQPFGRNHEALLPIDVTTAASERALVFVPWQAPEDWRAAVYQPTQLPVRAPSPEHAEGERAGSAACTGSEHSLAFAPAELAPWLSGEFVLCNGSLRSGAARLRFEPSHIELLAEDGGLIAQQAFDPASELVQFPTHFWMLSVSRRPLKVLVTERTQWRSASAVFSAVP